MSRCLIALVLAGCSRATPIGSCDDDLHGVYAGERSDQRWMVRDHGQTLEAYPLFPDGAAGAAEVGPRVLELERGSGPRGIEGTLRRRYMQRAELCEARVPVHVTRCAGETLELVLGDPAPPLAFAPCAWPGPGPSRVVRWRRE
jgi:hypothetical protein